MKKFYFLAIAFLALQLDAQEAGKVGELLKNEASKTEIASPKNEALSRTPNKSNEGFRNRNSVIKSSERNENRNPTYQWNQNYNFGYAEVFIRIPEQGFFSIELGNQEISNASGKYRFFDLSAGNQVISIYERGYLLYRTRINVRNNTRMVLDFFTNRGLYLLGTYQLRNNYGDVWNDTWNNPYGNGNGNSWDPYDDYNNQHGNSYENAMNDREFSSFLTMVKRQSFDDSKMDFMRSQLSRNSFNTKQIVALMNTLSFDKKKLELAKMAYRNCVDQRNYFDLFDAFDFESTARELNKFLQNQR